MVENLGLVGEASFAVIGANRKCRSAARVAEGWPRRPGRVIDASFKGRRGLAGFEEPVGEPVGDLELLGELSRRPFNAARG